MNKTVKKAGIAIGAVLLVLVAVLGVHIYIVTRPKPLDPKIVVMARIDMNEDINETDAVKISNWIDNQPGVNHTYVNPNTEIVVFTFFPAQTTGDKVVADFKAAFHYEKAKRFMPTTAQMGSGCPAGYGSSSWSSKILNVFK